MPRELEWSGRLCPEATLCDLDQGALRLAREKYLQDHERVRQDIEKWSDEHLLEKLKLLRDGKLTNAALLLLGKEGSSYKMNLSQVGIRWILRG